MSLVKRRGSLLGNYITQFGVVETLINRAKEDTCIVIHNMPAIYDRRLYMAREVFIER